MKTGKKPLTPKPIQAVAPFISEAFLLNMEILFQQQLLPSENVVGKLEEDFKNLLKLKTGVAFHHPSKAFELAFQFLHLIPGDEVLISPFISSPAFQTLQSFRLQISPGRIQPQTGNLDPKQLEAQLTPKTKAILVSDFAGIPSDLTSILSVASQHNIPVIEDVYDGLGAQVQNQWVGSLGRFGVFSFSPFSLLPCFSGALLASSEPKDQETISGMIDFDPVFGSNIAMDPANAILLLTSLVEFEVLSQQRKLNANQIRENLQSVQGLRFFPMIEGNQPSFFILPAHAENLEGLKIKFEKAGIRVFQPSLPNEFLKLPDIQCFLKTFVGIPCHLQLKEEDLNHIVQTLRSGW